MIRLSLLLLIFVAVGTAQSTKTKNDQIGRADEDSIVDVLPLAIGNLWRYSYSYNFEDNLNPVVMYQQCDTGTVDIQIIGKVISDDSTRWLVREMGKLWMQYNRGAFFEQATRIDSFELIELHQGNHRLYRVGNAHTSNSVFPFFVDLPETAQVYRYQFVDSTNQRTIKSSQWPGECWFTFKQGVGQTSYLALSNCTCGWTYAIHHTLRNSTITGVNNHLKEPYVSNYHLDQNYPNPFNPSTTFSFNLPEQSFVSLKVFDLIGKEVATIVSREMQSGNYLRQWNASSYTSGIYFYQLKASTFTETKRLILLK